MNRSHRVNAVGDGRAVNVGAGGGELGQVDGVAIGVAQRVGQQQSVGKLAVSNQAAFTGHLVAHGLGDALQGGVAFGSRSQAR